MKFMKALLAMLLVFGLVACSNEKPKNDEPTTVSYETFTKLYDKYGKKGVSVYFTPESGYVNATTIAKLENVDDQYFDAIKATLAQAQPKETTSAEGNLIARIDLKNRLDITYLNIYENNVISVRQHPLEVFYTVSDDTIAELLVEIQNCYDAYLEVLRG